MTFKTPTCSVPFDPKDTQEQAAHALLERLMKIRRLRYCQPADREEVAQEAVLRIVQEARTCACSFQDALDAQTVKRHTEAARSAARRRWKRAEELQPLCGEVQAGLAAKSTEPGEYCRSEVIEQIATKIDLTDNEREFLRLWFVDGTESYEELAVKTGLTKKHLYRVKNRLLEKLKQIPETVRALIGNSHEHSNARKRQLVSVARGWRQQSADVL